MAPSTNPMAGSQLALHRLKAPRFMLVSDLDHTMVQNEDPTHEHLALFNRLWSIHLAQHSILVFSTGRSPTLFLELWNSAPLLAPDVLICSVGTELFYRDPAGDYVPDVEWVALLDQGWNRDAAQRVAASLPQLQPQVATEQRRHKLSYHLKRGSSLAEDEAVIEQLHRKMAAAGVRAKVVYSGGVDVDVLPEGAGKGKALEFLLSRLQVLGRWPRDGVQVNGDSGNDVELFQVPSVRGCVVSNAHPELLAFHDALVASGSPTAAAIHLAKQPCAGGIVEALLAFNTLAAVAAPDASLSAVEDEAVRAVRNSVVALGTQQANALAGGIGPLASAGGASWITPSGRMLAVASTVDSNMAGQGIAATARPQPDLAAGVVDQSDAPPREAVAAGLAWVDDVALRFLPRLSAAVATYTLWSLAGGARSATSCMACTAVYEFPGSDGALTPAAVQPPSGESGEDGGRAPSPSLVHLHESHMAPEASATGAFERLALSF